MEVLPVRLLWSHVKSWPKFWRISYDEGGLDYYLEGFPLSILGTAALWFTEKSFDNFSGNNENCCLTSLAHLSISFLTCLTFFHTLLWLPPNVLHGALFSCQQVAVILLLKSTVWLVPTVTLSPDVCHRHFQAAVTESLPFFHLSLLLPVFPPWWDFTLLWKQWLLYPCVMLISCLAYASSWTLHPLFRHHSSLSLGGNLQCDAVIFMLSVNLH